MLGKPEFLNMTYVAGLGAFIGYKILKGGGSRECGQQERGDSSRQERGLSSATVVNIYCAGQRGTVLWRFLLADSGTKPMKIVILTPGNSGEKAQAGDLQGKASDTVAPQGSWICSNSL